MALSYNISGMRKVLISAVFLFSLPVVSWPGDVAPQLLQHIAGMKSNDTVSVIITLNNSLDLAALRTANPHANPQILRGKLVSELRRLAKLNQSAIANFLFDTHGISAEPLWVVNSLAVELPVSLVSVVAKLPRVVRVDLDAIVTLAAPIPATQAPSEWNLQMIKADRIWQLGYTGQGVVVANMDTGVDLNHADLVQSWRGGTNSWFDAYGQHATPADKNGHGTGTMSLIAGSNTGGTNIGVAPGAKWIAAKIFNDAGLSSTSAIHQAFQWFLDPDGDPNTDDAPHVVNASWGLDLVNACETTFLTDVQVLKAANISVVFSAGNSGPSPATSVSPANYDISYSAGAVDQNSYIASFSSRGPSACVGATVFPHVVAPGVNIKMADLTAGGLFPNAYVYGSGTSFSAPHVAGAMALLRSAYPVVTVDALENAFNSTAADLLNPSVDNDTGYGLINTLEALYTFPIDTDGDGVLDSQDNCVLISNLTQLDADGDGFGNRCDADLNNSLGPVNTADYLLFRLAFATLEATADFNGSGGPINTADYLIFRQLFGKPPGPSGLVR